MRPRVLFRVAAGPRIGFGHLVRSRTLASALGVRPLVSLRGAPGSRTAASLLGCRVVSGAIGPAFQAARPSLLVVDDPRAGASAPWVRAARRLGVATASVHDLGVAPCRSDLSIDGSMAPGPMDLAGIRYAVIDPRLRHVRAARRWRLCRRPVVLVAFGGGPRRKLAQAVAQAIVRRRPDVRVRVAGGFHPAASRDRGGAIRVVPPRRGLAAELRSATVAVLAGGVTLHEACAVGLPAIGVSIVPAQRRAVAALARRGAVIDGGAASSVGRTAARVARLVDDLFEAPGRQRRLAASARRLVDGRGAGRVAAALDGLMARAATRRVSR